MNVESHSDRKTGVLLAQTEQGDVRLWQTACNQHVWRPTEDIDDGTIEAPSKLYQRPGGKSEAKAIHDHLRSTATNSRTQCDLTPTSREELNYGKSEAGSRSRFKGRRGCSDVSESTRTEADENQPDSKFRA